MKLLRSNLFLYLLINIFMIVSDIKILEGTQIGYQLIFTKDEPKIIKYENYKKIEEIDLLNAALLRFIDYNKETDMYEFKLKSYKHERYYTQYKEKNMYDYNNHTYDILLKNIELVNRNNEIYIKIHVYQEILYKDNIASQYLIDYLYLNINKLSYSDYYDENNEEYN